MKTLTEFSTLTLRKAAAARSAARSGRTVTEGELAQAASEDAANKAAVAKADAEGTEPPADAEAPAVEAAEGEAPAVEAAADGEAAPAAEAAPDPTIGAVAEALGVPPEKAQRLLEALDVVGGSIDQVRLVRVFQGEKGPHGAVTRGEFHYVIDRVARKGGGRGGERRDDRGGRGGDRGGDRGRGGGDRGGGGGGGRGGGGGFGGDRGPAKPRGLSSLMHGGPKVEQKEDDRPARGEMPKAGVGWQLTAAPRDFGGGGREGRGGPRRDRNDRGDRRGPGGPRGDRGPRGPGGGGGGDRGPRGFGGGDRGPRGPRLGPDGQPLPFEARGDRGPRGPRLGPDGQPLPPREPRPPREPQLGPDGQPLPPRPKRERKPIGPDANGMGPDGKPWDPERRVKMQAERDAKRAEVNAPQAPVVEATPAPEAPAPKE